MVVCCYLGSADNQRGVRRQLLVPADQFVAGLLRLTEPLPHAVPRDPRSTLHLEK